ncbi:hypothetical protein [Pararhizobium gei]|uniref:hypothetical protein n=1 Tax=Pararhizobium gei TaxID=1395951 RepID=UPI0023D9F877|nr:hypothetical protein [Rhizobium gei]
MVLAFRLYGDFYWPPHAKVSDLDGETRRGTVEIRYQEKIAGGALRPLLRWIPGSSKGDPGKPGDIHESLFKIEPKKAVQWFADNAENDCAIWIDAGGDIDQDWVSFRGAFLIDQYKVPETGGDAILDLRWPLVRTCQYFRDITTFSGLVVGRAKGPRYYLDLNLPLPARRTTRPGKNETNPAAFPFGAVFEPGKDDILQFTTLVGGWIGRDAVPSVKTEDLDTSFVFADDRFPHTRLGSFGFAARGRVQDGHFAVFDGQQKEVKIAAKQYWPDDSRVFTQDMLHCFGFSADAASTAWLTLKTEGSTTDLSLRFERTPDARKPVLVYRVSVSGQTGRSGDIKSDEKTLSLRLHEETGGWVETGDTLRADCRLSWDIEDKNIWTSGNWTPEVDLTLLWHNSLTDDEALRDRPVKPSGSGIGMLRAATRSSRQAQQGLQVNEPSHTASFLPDLRAAGKQKICFTLYGPKFRAGYDLEAAEAIWGNRKPEIPFVRPPLRLTLARVTDLIPSSDDTKGLGDNSMALIASGQNFFSGKNDVAIVLTRDGEWAEAAKRTEDRTHLASYLVEQFEPQQPWSGRLSSLRFQNAAADDPDLEKHAGKNAYSKPADDFSAWLRIGASTSATGRRARTGDAPVAVALRLFLPVSDIEPTGLDVARADRTNRPLPLLIAQGKAGKPLSGTNYWLAVTESIGDQQDRRIEADIYESAPEAGERVYVVLSEDPFSIFRYVHKPLSDRGDAGSASVAYYSGDDRIWQYRKVVDHYHFTFPPQAVGESADKPGRLELHDLLAAGKDDPSDSLRPYVKDPENPSDGLRRRAVEFRLTPSAEIWIRPSDVERGYFMPESASYELFRQRGEYGRGAALAFLRAEFLYGLPVGIDVSKEGAVSSQARVAEIEALTGRLAGPARDAKAESKLASRWIALSRAASRRPERLEIWARDPGSKIDFTPARFSSGAAFSLRGTALHRPPLEKLEQPEDGRLWPRAGGGEPGADRNKPRSHPQGISGGALWPVESVNLFNALMKNPECVGGTIESIALSPTGGDAVQKASFLQGVVTIISETRNGFIERQKVEVNGRIGAFWHRAKHVVVYERTVNIPAQFAPEFGDDPHRSRSRRPILRKVREYIEFLQHERTYPDFSKATTRHAGFLERVRFNSKTINVDSNWASEVGEHGWKIPLWNRHSAKQRPQVYPMPDVAFVTVAEGDGEKPVVSQECLDTDNLFFFCDFGAGGDTDAWNARPGIDFADMPAAAQLAAVADAPAAAPQNGERRKSIGRFLPGLRRFTWRLAPAAQKTAINAGRFGKPVYVGLESVSFMRATQADAKHAELPNPLKTILEKAQKLGAPQSTEDTSLSRWNLDGTGAATPAAAAFSDQVATLLAALKSGDTKGTKDALQTLSGAWEPALKQVVDILVPQGNALAEKLGDWSKIEPPAIGLQKSACEKLKSDAVLAIRRKEMLVCTALGDWIAGVDAVLKPIQDDPDLTKTLVIDALCADIQRHLKPLFLDAGADIGKLGENVEKARAVLLDFEQDLDIIIQRARKRTEDFAAAYDREKPWSAERRSNFHAGLQACIGNIGRDISGAVDEARQRLAIELDDASQAAGGHIAKALGAIAGSHVAIPADLMLLNPAVTRLMDPIRVELDKLAPSAGVGELAKVRADIANADISQDLKDKAQATIEGLEAAIATVRDAAAEAEVAAATIDTLAQAGAVALETEVKAFKAALATGIENLGSSAQSLLDLAAALADTAAQDLRSDIARIQRELDGHRAKLADRVDSGLTKIGYAVDPTVRATVEWLATWMPAMQQQIAELRKTSTVYFDEIKGVFGAVQAALGPEALLDSIVINKCIRPAMEKLLAALFENGSNDVAKIGEALDGLGKETADAIRKLDDTALEGVAFISDICGVLFESADSVISYIKGVSTDAAALLAKRLKSLSKPFSDMTRQIEEVLNAGGDLAAQADRLTTAVKAFDYSVRGLQNDLSRTMETARMYGDRVFDAAAGLGDGGLMAAPSNILRLYSAASSAPELAAMKADIDRIRASFDEIQDAIQTTEASALFDRRGDGLKALGLTLPFNQIGDRLVPADLTRFDIGKVFGNLGGIDLGNLFKTCKIPEGVSDAVRISHDFDKAQARAWVQIDIDVPMPGRWTLFSLGIFQIDFVDMHLTGRVRLEASKDQREITQTGFSRIGTIIDVVVAGQSMVRFEKFGLNFTRESGLRTEFDPKDIRLNPSFKFIQDFLSSLFPREVGGLKIVKQDNIPVGIEHIFAIPPMTLNFGTSGISNISIENHFKLLAFPDFALANRFNLSTLERPFIFSIFIIGGTGYIQIDTEYRPFDNQLTVNVEAGAGGSAALAFAIGPFVGQVFITLSGVMTYRKMIGGPGGGLSIAVVVVIAGQVQVCGMVSIGITLMLRLSYRDNGDINGQGTLSVSIRISRFFKITARANVDYKLRGGKSETSVNTGVSASTTPKLDARIEQARQAVDQLQRASN